MSPAGAAALLLAWMLAAGLWRSGGASWPASILTAAVTVTAFAGLGLLLSP